MNFVKKYLPCLLILIHGSLSISKKQVDSLKQTVKEMFYHSYDNYMKYAFPMDELDPIRCCGKGRDYVNPKNDINDVLGDYCLTLIDALDTLVVIGDYEEFQRAVGLIVKFVDFNRHANTVQVFESNIRILGGLLSGHLLASDYIPNNEWYDGELLRLAYDFGLRLLPAFNVSASGLPYARVNLVYGHPPDSKIDTCTAGAGTLILEFGLLSRLTGDARFEIVAKKTLDNLWSRRSSINLVGNLIDVETGEWIYKDSGIGAGIDSFHEYLLKAYIMFGDDEYLQMFQMSYDAVLRHVRDPDGFLYRPVNMDNGTPITSWIDSLSAFFPGLQVLYGDLTNAIRLHELYYTIWKKYGSLPERFDVVKKTANLAYYPLRPELIESTYFLYRATKNPYYLEAGMRFVLDLQTYTRTTCGYAGLRHVVMKNLDDRMESFYLSETLKYLYLLFDEDNLLNHDESLIFTTEAHIFMYNNISSPIKNSLICKPLQSKLSLVPQPLITKVERDYIDHLVGTDNAKPVESVGICLNTEQNRMIFQNMDENTFTLKSLMEKFGSEFSKLVFTPISNPEPPSVSLQWTEDGDLLLNSLNEINIALTAANDEILLSKINDKFTINPGRRVYVSQKGIKDINVGKDLLLDLNMAILRVFKPAFLNVLNPMADLLEVNIPLFRNEHFRKKELRFFEDFRIIPAVFGPSVKNVRLNETVKQISFKYALEGDLIYLPENSYSCTKYSEVEKLVSEGNIILAKRGNCMFYEKVVNAQEAGAAAVIIMNSDNSIIQMNSGDSTPHISIPSFFISLVDSERILKHLRVLSTTRMNVVKGAVVTSDVLASNHEGVPAPEELESRNILTLNNKHVKNLFILTEKEYESMSLKISNNKEVVSIPRIFAYRRKLLFRGMKWSCLRYCKFRNNFSCCA